MADGNLPKGWGKQQNIIPKAWDRTPDKPSEQQAPPVGAQETSTENAAASSTSLSAETSKGFDAEQNIDISETTKNCGPTAKNEINGKSERKDAYENKAEVTPAKEKKTKAFKASAVVLVIALIAATSALIVFIVLYFSGKSRDNEEKVSTTSIAETSVAETVEATEKPTESIETEAPTTEPTAELTAKPTEVPKPTVEPTMSPEVVSQLRSIISQSDAEGYTIAKILGNDNDQLILSFGEIEVMRHYDFYSISDSEVVFLGSLDSGHSSAYIDDTTGTFAKFFAHQGYYYYGPVVYDGGLSVDSIPESTIAPGEEYPDYPGERVEFNSIDDFSVLADYLKQ